MASSVLHSVHEEPLSFADSAIHSHLILFEMRCEIIIERRGILEYTLFLKKESLLNLLHLSIHRFHGLI